MTLITPEVEIAGLEDLLASIRQSIRDLRHDLEGLREQVQTGGEFDATETARTLSRARVALEHCQKVETNLAESRNKQAGIAQGGYALDLERARAEIGCKLDRLRCTPVASCVSE